MKSLFIILNILAVFISCKSDPKKNQILIEKAKIDTLQLSTPSKVSLKLPIGFYKLLDYDFPKKWNNLQEIDDNNPNFKVEKISNKGYDSISYFIEKKYNFFYDSLKVNRKDKLKSIPKISKTIDENISNFFKVDSSYYVYTLGRMANYSIKLFKDGGKFNNLKGNENFSVVNYLTMVTYDNSDNIKDLKTIYYHDNNIISYENIFFYIDKNLNITLKKFTFDELETNFLGIQKYKINKNGTFENVEY